MYKSLRAQTLHYFARPHEAVRREPLRTAAAWKGAELRDEPSWQAPLAAAEIDELKHAVAFATATGKPLGDMTRADFPLPTLSRRIDDWRREIRHGRGFVLVRGVPVREWTTAQSELFFWCFGQHLGLPGAQNPQGDL